MVETGRACAAFGFQSRRVGTGRLPRPVSADAGQRPRPAGRGVGEPAGRRTGAAGSPGGPLGPGRHGPSRRAPTGRREMTQNGFCPLFRSGIKYGVPGTGPEPAEPVSASRGGVIFHNNPDDTCGWCSAQTPTLLPSGTRLLIVPPKGAVAPGPGWYDYPVLRAGNNKTPRVP